MTGWFWGVVSEAVEELRRSPQRGIPTPDRLERNGPLTTIILQVYLGGGVNVSGSIPCVTVMNCSPPPAGGLQPGLVRPAPRGFVSRLARCGPGLADRQPLLGREDHRGGGHIGLLPAALLLRTGWSP